MTVDTVKNRMSINKRGKADETVAVPYSRTLIGDLPWYSVLVVTGIALAIWLAGAEEKRMKLPQDTAIDLALIVVPFGIAGARLYYVLMSWELFANDPISAFYIWRGGLAIYGGVIGGAFGAWCYARKKRIHFALLADMVAPGLLLAQALGRWGNYFNMEAYGPLITDARMQFFPLAVYIPADGGWHAATFFYESVWNLAGFFALWLLRRKMQYRGSVFAWYLLIYGAGRFIIEQLRQDSLYIGALRASQWLSLLLCTAAAGYLLCNECTKSKKRLFINAGCAVMWLIRWGALSQHALYAGVIITAGITALWLGYKKRQSLSWMIAALMMDGLGLLACVFSWPFSSAAQGIHALMCSTTLPMGIWALCTSREK